ncbi:phytanoyl-CoA dioxygenase family protein [Ahrensia sp. R2A130]|uniref:phytanoyl-CoA dioxygenase family protein n=1 Tax=Ahrensia sp. R2A130 TaxID=744979 RepID=UPI0001E0D0DC|nr:phytanoyl-CoA dioxygenase family protein [Ahrensia sp. R2A130]EFL89253.1 phytanoyl-CoA dioxygenase PhyH family protein [Ahrensia sp. R2A130]
MQTLHTALSNTVPERVPELLASRPDRGWYLFADIDGTKFARDAKPEDRYDILSCFAAIQVGIHAQYPNMGHRRYLPTNELVENFFMFVNGEEIEIAGDGSANLSQLVGSEKAEGYRAKLGPQRDRLQELVSRSDSLPVLLEHCDLRTSNAMRCADGSTVIFDWDDALLAPAGYSLHAQFSGAARVYRALRAAPAAMAGTDNPIASDLAQVMAWATPLMKAGLLDERALRSAVPSAAVAGVMHYVLGFADYPPVVPDGSSTIARNITRRLDDLVMVLKMYEASVAPPADTIKQPTSPKVEPAKTSHWSKLAVTFTQTERESGDVASTKLDEAAELFGRNGTLIMENAFSTAHIERMREAYLSQYGSYLSSANHDDTLRVGDKRFMVTLAMNAPFDEPDFFAAKPIMPVVKRLLSDDAILGSYTCVTSLPGSKDQRMHKDHSALFPEAGEMALPPFAMTMIVPLVDLTEETGTTRLVPESHRISSSASKSMPHVDPHLTIGSAFLMDFRLSHRGLANRSLHPRPIVSMVYQRPWFRDYLNYDNQSPVDLADLDISKLSPEHAKLLSWL